MCSSRWIFGGNAPHSLSRYVRSPDVCVVCCCLWTETKFRFIHLFCVSFNFCTRLPLLLKSLFRFPCYPKWKSIYFVFFPKINLASKTNYRMCKLLNVASRSVQRAFLSQAGFRPGRRIRVRVNTSLAIRSPDKLDDVKIVMHYLWLPKISVNLIQYSFVCIL